MIDHVCLDCGACQRLCREWLATRRKHHCRDCGSTCLEEARQPGREGADVQLKWACDGKCGKVLEDGRDQYFIFELTEVPDDGQLIRLCKECAASKITRRKGDQAATK